MSGRVAGAAGDGPGDADRSSTPGDPLSPREVLAEKLGNLAVELRETYEKLTTTWPDHINKERTMIFWQRGLGMVRVRIGRVRSLLKECQEFAASEARTKDPGQQDDADAGAEDEPDELAEALTQLGEAIKKAIQKALAAHHSLEMPDQAFSAGSRSNYYVKAVAQLRELGFRCDAVAVLIGGSEALARREAGAAQAEAYDA